MYVVRHDDHRRPPFLLDKKEPNHEDPIVTYNFARGWLDNSADVGIDHILVRGLDASPPVRWPDERRLHEGRLLSDHAPVEREVT